MNKLEPPVILLGLNFLYLLEYSRWCLPASSQIGNSTSYRSLYQPFNLFSV